MSITTREAIALRRSARRTPPTSRDASRSHLLRGRAEDPAWARPALLVLLLGTGLLYLWNLSASGDANSYYAAAVQAGSKSWKAWFFGSFDQASYITVDKPPASLWVMGLSARIFGYSSWSMLVPQALEGVATVALVVATVRRVAGVRVGLLAGALTALTPAAVMMFRFNNPDALLLLLVVAATYAVTRAIDDGRTRWLLLAGAAIGFAFLTKSGQALLVVPALGLAYLVAGPHTWVRRLGQLMLALLTLVVSSGWYLLTVALWPASSRPYIGGSTNNSAWELAFGYNGLGRLFGGSGNGGGGGGGGGNSGFGGATGLGRLFTGEFGLEISWLLPAALLGIVGLAWLTRKGSRRDPMRAALIVWGGSLLLTATTFSYMQGTIHPYYSVALAPSVAALVALALSALWKRAGIVATAILATSVLTSSIWAVVLLRRAGQGTTLEATVLAVSVLATIAIVLRATGHVVRRRTVAAVVVAAVLALGLPTAVWGARTAATPHSGSIPTAVSTSSSGGSSGGGPGGGGTGGTSRSSSALATALAKTTTTWSAATSSANGAASLEIQSNTAIMALGGFTGSDDAITLAQFEKLVAEGKVTYYLVDGQGGGGQGPTSSSSTTSSSTTGSSTATSSSTSASTSTAASGSSGSTGRTGGGPGGSSSISSITSWVTTHFTQKTIGGQTVYDLTDPT